jgi:transposase-like protein
MLYTETFKARMVRRMLGPRAVSAHALSAEAGVSQPTLSRWLRETSTFRAMAKKDQNKAPPPMEAEAARRPQDWTAAERLRAVAETLALDGEALGDYLRRKGIHLEQLEQWRRDAQAALEQPRRQRRPAAETKRIKELERELRKKEKALAEAAALLVLRKKLHALWGDEDDDTDGSKEP